MPEGGEPSPGVAAPLIASIDLSDTTWINQLAIDMKYRSSQALRPFLLAAVMHSDIAHPDNRKGRAHER
jgi:hypothetical protein